MLWQVPDLENIADDDSQARAVKNEEEALLDFHVTLIHKWIHYSKRTGEGEAAGNLEGDRIRYYHIYFQTLYQKKGEKKHFVQSKATQHSTTSSIHIKSEWIQSSKKSYYVCFIPEKFLCSVDYIIWYVEQKMQS